MPLPHRSEYSNSAVPTHASGPLPHLETEWGAKAYASAVDQLGILSVTDASGRIVYVNDEFTRISGFARHELIGTTHKVLNSGHHPRSFFQDMHQTISNGRMWRSVMQNRAKDGSIYWVDALIVPLGNAGGDSHGYFSLQMNITENVNLHIEVLNKNALLQSVVESYPGGIQIFDETLRLAVWNRKLKEVLDYPQALFASGPPTLEQVIRYNSDLIGTGSDKALVEGLERVRVSEPYEFECRRPNGKYLEVRGIPIYGGGHMSTYVDISERKKNEEIVARLAHHDSLTGLPNRALFQDRMREGMARVRRGESFALLCIDLDRFKAVNDTLGHPVGDELLKSVAGRLQNCVRETDTVARLGGDEFAIILTATKAARDVQVAATRVVAAMRMPFRIGENTIEIGSSVGIAIAPTDGNEPSQLMQHADLALYRAKAAGRGRFEFFEKGIQEQLKVRTALVAGLQDALNNKEFEVHYQPIVNLVTRRIAGCEALIRWRHPVRGLIPASEFIPVAEEVGLIGRIGEWAMKTACLDAARWPDDIWLSVNVSAAQLRDHKLIDKVQKSLMGLDPSRLILEITETLLIQDRTMAAGIMLRLKDLGVRLALDDFGTGFSSLNYLQIFPFDKIKIDRSFVSTVTNNERATALRRAIIRLAKDLGMSATAEGVETQEQLDQLIAEGCQEAQGYLFAKPAAVSALKPFFDRGNAI